MFDLRYVDVRGEFTNPGHRMQTRLFVTLSILPFVYTLDSFASDVSYVVSSMPLNNFIAFIFYFNACPPSTLLLVKLSLAALCYTFDCIQTLQRFHLIHLWRTHQNCRSTTVSQNSIALEKYIDYCYGNPN